MQMFYGSYIFLFIYSFYGKYVIADRFKLTKNKIPHSFSVAKSSAPFNHEQALKVAIVCSECEGCVAQRKAKRSFIDNFFL